LYDITTLTNMLVYHFPKSNYTSLYKVAFKIKTKLHELCYHDNYFQ
jgi:hypothetical protein